MTWLIKRNCSASPTQLAAVFGSLVAVSLVFGAVFAALGLWMVLPFVGLELVAVAAAFLLHGRHAADVERIELADDKLTVEGVEADRCRRWEFDRRRVRVGALPGQGKSQGKKRKARRRYLWMREVRVLRDDGRQTPILTNGGVDLKFGKVVFDYTTTNPATTIGE